MYCLVSVVVFQSSSRMLLRPPCDSWDAPGILGSPLGCPGISLVISIFSFLQDFDRLWKSETWYVALDSIENTAFWALEKVKKLHHKSFGGLNLKFRKFENRKNQEIPPNHSNHSGWRAGRPHIGPPARHCEHVVNYSYGFGGSSLEYVVHLTRESSTPRWVI